jgi:hypothetical protein
MKKVSSNQGNSKTKLLESKLRKMIREELKNSKPPLVEGKTSYQPWTPNSNIEGVGDFSVSDFAKHGFKIMFPKDWLEDTERNWADSIWFKVTNTMTLNQVTFLLKTRPDDAGMEDGLYSLWWD